MTNPTTITTPDGLPFVDIIRDFDAPRELVFRAYVDPNLVRQWQGPRRYVTAIGEWDARTGGAWSYVSTDPDDGAEYGFRGVFHAVDEPTSITQTFEYAGVPGHVNLDRVVFEDLGDGRTRVTSRTAFQSLEDRDGMVASGMSYGVTEGNERLDELLASLA
ncbi:MAG: polyketide cyclase [Glaciihabitans sp.]|nr:polyketide cyclase [Glaciihabitans sp.]